MSALSRIGIALILVFALAACESADQSPLAPEGLTADSFAPGMNLTSGGGIQMDIQPLLKNNVMLKSNWGALRVAVVGTEDFDVLDVDVSSLRLEGVRAYTSWTSDCTGPLDDVGGSTGAGAAVLRLNAGGPELAGSPVWQDDSNFTTSNYANIGYAAVTTEAIDMSDASIPAGTPMELFQSERYDNTGLPDMMWELPVDNGDYTVRLYFADNYPPQHGVGNRVFDITIENQLLTGAFDIFERVGGFAGLVMEYPVSVADGGVTIDFGRIAANPTICGIEILEAGSAPEPTAGAGVRERDGIDDLSVVFAKRGLFAALGPVEHGDTVTLTLTGNLNDGTPFTAVDEVKILVWSWGMRRY